MAKSNTTPKNALTMLKADHENVQKLFEQFEAAEEQSEKDEIIEKAIGELKIHASLEEEIFYPAVREAIDEEDLMNEAEVEHQVAKYLIAQLEEPSDDEDRRNAKFKVLCESVKHHIEEEEGEMFPQVEEQEIDLVALGDEMAERRQKLQTEVSAADNDETSPESDSEEDKAENSTKSSRARNDVPVTKMTDTREKTTIASGKGSGKMESKPKQKA